MFSQIRRLFNQLWNRSRTINNEPLNKVSLIVIIIIDIFILINVFAGLDDISRWHISPTDAYPCYSEWKNYREQKSKDKDFEIIQSSLPLDPSQPQSWQQSYLDNKTGKLGNLSEVCIQYAADKDKINNRENINIAKSIDQKQKRISSLEQTNNTIRSQYDSTLLEKIAGQKKEQSINLVGAEKAKQELDKNNRTISTLKQEISNQKNQLVTKPESAAFLAFLKENDKFNLVEQGYKQASFWYPSIQLSLQSLFLVPLIIIALSVYKFAQRRGYGLITLISWHLLVIFFIPLILKIFEFLQVGAIFQFIFDIISAILGGLLFLVSYVYILLIPLIGFGIIKFLQKIVFNAKIQAANRVQKLRCIRCARKIRHDDAHCPHCGYYQYTECPNCHQLTYKYLPYCKECGHVQQETSGDT